MSGRWGLYVLADQMIYRDSPGADRGLTVFAGFTYADPSTALLQYFWEVGTREARHLCGPRCRTASDSPCRRGW